MLAETEILKLSIISNDVHWISQNYTYFLIHYFFVLFCITRLSNYVLGIKTPPDIVELPHNNWSKVLVKESIEDRTGAGRTHPNHVTHTKHCNQQGLRLQVQNRIFRSF